MSKRRKPQSGTPSTTLAIPPQQQRRVMQARIAASFSGPLPPPEILIGYNAAVPDAAERILALAERQAAHRMGLENRVIDADIHRANWGLIAGFIVALAFLGASVGLVMAGREVAGVIIGSLDIVGLVGVFVYGTISRKGERRERREDLLADED